MVIVKFSFYTYALDFNDAAGISNQTYGLRYSTTFELDSVQLPLVLEYADQDDQGDSPVSYSTSYYLAERGVRFEKASIGFGYEVL